MGKNQKAKDCFEKAIEINPNQSVAFSNLGIIFKELGEDKKAKDCLEKAVEIEPNNPFYHNNLGILYVILLEYQKGISCFEKAIELKPNFLMAHLRLGKTFFKLKKFEESEISFKKLIELKPDYLAAYSNLGTVLTKINKLDEAEVNYTKALNLKPGFRHALMNRGLNYFNKGKFELSLKDYDDCNDSQTKALSLMSLYALGRIDEIYERIERDSKLEEMNLNIAAFSSFISTKVGKKTANNFCKNPIDFIYYSNLKKHLKNSALFIDKAVNELDTVKTVWEPIGRTTRKGFQSTGLLDTSLVSMKDLKSIILKEIDSYYSKFKNETCTYIKKWPIEKKLYSWHVVLKKQGYQSLHMHPTGWLSGVIYLKVVPTLEKLEGAIEFTLNGEFYSAANSPKLIFQPKVGDIVLFPSTLHHRTIPFSTEDDRITISFDLRPSKIN